MHPLYEALYREAVDLARAEGSASNAFLQRMMDIPYNVAAELVRGMQNDGILSREGDGRSRLPVIGPGFV
jgi:DNA segregation ATPase FtsK/SpoIIIE-like protein